MKALRTMSSSHGSVMNSDPNTSTVNLPESSNRCNASSRHITYPHRIFVHGMLPFTKLLNLQSDQNTLDSALPESLTRIFLLSSRKYMSMILTSTVTKTPGQAIRLVKVWLARGPPARALLLILFRAVNGTAP